MLPLLTDEDLQGAIVAGVLLHFPAIDLVRAQDAGLMQTPDPIIPCEPPITGGAVWGRAGMAGTKKSQWNEGKDE